MLIRPLCITVMMLGGSAFAVTNSVIVVSAPRLDDLDLMAVDTAADVTVIDRAVIEQSGAVSVPELLQSEANLLVRSSSGNGNDGQISMRGMGENSHLRALVLVDGHKVNRPDMAGIEWGSIPVSNIEKIEIIRGGQNVLYGNHALSGVVKITTKRGADAGTQFGGSFGSFGYRSAYATYGGSAGDIDYVIGVSSFSSDGFRSNSFSRAATFFGSASWYTGDADTLTFRGSYSDGRNIYPGPLSYAEMQADPRQSYTNGLDYSESTSGLATLIWETERDWGAARIRSGVSSRNLNWEQGTIAENRIMGYSFGPRVRYGSTDSFLMGGVDAHYDTVDFDNLHPENTAYVQAFAELERLTFAPYFLAQRRIEPGLVFNGGARYERARTDNRYVDYVDNQILPTIELLGIGTVPNPNYKSPPDADPAESYEGRISKAGWAAELSLAYEAPDAWSVWAGYDRVYRYPTLDESAAYQGYPLSEPLNDALDPETGHNFELGLRARSGCWSGSLTGYYLLLDDEIVFVQIPADPISGTPAVSLNQNAGATRRLGTELELDYEQAWYGASSRWALVDAQNRGGTFSGKRVPLVPAFHAVSSVWVTPVDFLRFSASFTYVGRQYQGGDQANEERRMDAYGLLGVRLGAELTDAARLEIAVENVTDEVYASSAYYSGFYPGAGRSYRVGINWEF